MGAPLVVLPGLTEVVCPVCRARPGRPCVNRRGYRADGSFHRQRRAAWLALERAEARPREGDGPRVPEPIPADVAG